MSCAHASIDAPVRRIGSHANVISYAMRIARVPDVLRRLVFTLVSRCVPAHIHPVRLSATAHSSAPPHASASLFFACCACLSHTFCSRARAQNDAFLNATSDVGDAKFA
ncbi:hypothetical protein K788_0004585 [Paraburkholderia caribensis MBA4]|uniref:Uncharacterized protein n=1 Tax=Paraburkholderia caribensis MBA4 TaxID=1323664 RepID=A0A0P0RAG5_9BURK|nr:hypothetical protein K788_0004585 [Paraburkholderia caribensis MBA4]